jgi:hypothetical protein
MTTSLINNEEINGVGAKDLDPESQSMGMGEFDTASMSSRLREERAKHMSIQGRDKIINQESGATGGGIINTGK